MPGEVSYKEAHQIGIELADKLLEGKYSYIVATHIDKGHVHNHIIFCAADNINHEKYHDCKKTYYHIRHLNDELCSEHQLKDLGQILKYAEQYQSNHIYHVRYQKSKNPNAYLRSHETELILHGGAENMLKRLGMNPKTLDIEKLRNEYNSLYSKKETLQKTYKSAEKEINALNRKLDNLNQYLNRSSSVQQTNDRKPEKNQTTL